MSIFDLSGPEFLKLFGAIMAVALATAFLLRWILRGPGDEMMGEPQLDAYQIACLTGGARGAVDTAIASLVHQQVIDVSRYRRQIKLLSELPPKSDILEAAVVNAVKRTGGMLRDVRRAAIPAAWPKFSSMENLGLVMSDGQAWLARLIPAGIFLILLLVGLQKIFVGISRNRPVIFLAMLCILCGTAATLFLFRRPLRTRRGDRYLKQLRDRHTALQTTARHSAQNLAYDDFGMAVGLFGTGILVSTVYSDLGLMGQKERPQNVGSSCSSCGAAGISSSCGSSCSSGSSCGGGGGCGGCGGGGD